MNAALIVPDERQPSFKHFCCLGIDEIVVGDGGTDEFCAVFFTTFPPLFSDRATRVSNIDIRASSNLINPTNYSLFSSPKTGFYSTFCYLISISCSNALLPDFSDALSE